MIDELTDELYDDCLAGGMQLLSTDKNVQDLIQFH